MCSSDLYLEAVNPNDGAPALQHAYAATTYQAQGATVDRAYVMADPSMDRQELYVAASRSREETYFYATPEVDLEREEYAPHSPGREGLAHIAAAAERDGAQVSAHDQALRSRLDPLVNLLIRRGRQHAPDHRAPVLRRLKQARHEEGLVVMHGPGFRLKADIRGVLSG